MAISFVNVGTVASSGAGGNITPALPAAIAAGDILVLVVGSADNVAVTLPAAYTKKIELNSGTNCRLTVAWARATGSDSAPLVTHAAGDSIFGVIGAYRGCASAGDPFTDAQSQASAAITTTITAPTITPLNGDFVIFAAAEGEGGTNNGSSQSVTAWSGANPTFTTRANYTDAGLGVHLVAGGFATGPSTGGATGSRTATLAVTAQATANSVGALLALTQDAGGSSLPATGMLPLTGLRIPGQPAVAPPIGATRGSNEDPNARDVVTPLPISQFVHPLSLVMATRLFPSPQPYVQPAAGSVQTLTGTITGVSTISATLVKTAVITGTITGTSAISATIVKTAVLTPTINGASTISASLVKTARIQPTINGATTISASLVKTARIQPTINGVTTISGTLVKTAILNPTISGSSTITATLTGSSSASVSTLPDAWFLYRHPPS